MVDWIKRAARFVRGQGRSFCIPYFSFPEPNCGQKEEKRIWEEIFKEMGSDFSKFELSSDEERKKNLVALGIKKIKAALNEEIAKASDPKNAEEILEWQPFFRQIL